MTAETVTIDSQIFSTYANVSMADLYMLAAFHGATWATLTDPQKSQLLVTATRIIDRQCWLGTRTEDLQELEWPRKGTGIVGVEDDVVPQAIISGSIELALLVADGSEVQSDPLPGAQKLSSIRAGSVSLSWFQGAEGVVRFQRFPQIVQELLRKFMCGSVQAVGGVIASDTDRVSVTADDFGFREGI